MRDHRMDVIRGIAIIGIAINHLAVESAGLGSGPRYEFGHVFAFNFADVFILFSGIVSGIVYDRIRRERGLGACANAAGRRVWQIWGAHLLCYGGLIAMFQLARAAGVPQTNYDYSLGDQPLQTLLGTALFYKTAPYLNILPLYVMFLAVMPGMLVLLERSRAGYFVISGGIWALCWLAGTLGQAGVISDPIGGGHSHFFIFPLSGQFEFFLGVALGVHKAAVEAVLERRRGAVMLGAITLLLGLDYLSQTGLWIGFFDQKLLSGPARIVALLAVLSLVHLAFPSKSEIGVMALLAPCGRNSLGCFVVSILGAAAMSWLGSALEVDQSGYLLLVLGNVMLVLLAGVIFDLRKRKRRAAQQGAMPARPRPGLARG